MRAILVPPWPMGLAFGGLEVQLLETTRSLRRLSVDATCIDPCDRHQFDEVDVVHFFGIDSSHCTLAGLLARRRIPYVVSTVYYPSLHKDWYRDRLRSVVPGSTRRALRRFLNGAAALLPNSGAEAAALDTAWALPHNKIIQIPNAARWREEAMAGLFYGTHLQKRIRPDERFVLSVARLERRKNTLALLRATRAVGAFLVLIGSDAAMDRQYGAAVRDAVAAHPQGVLHVEALDPYAPLLESAYEDCWTHALISTIETPGLSSLEAGAHGANLVVGDCAPVRQYFSHIARMCWWRDETSIRDAVRMALSAHRNERGQRETIRREYSWDRVAQMTLDVYRTVANRTLND